MTTHNICFHGEIRKNVNTFGLQIVSCQELCSSLAESCTLRSKFFLFRVDSFSEGTGGAGKQTGSHKTLVKHEGKSITSVSSATIFFHLFFTCFGHIHCCK